MVLKRWVALIIVTFLMVGPIASCESNPAYPPSSVLKEELQAASKDFGEAIPLPDYLPEGYALRDIQVNQPPDSRKEVDLTFSKKSKSDITLAVTWWSSGLFRILPTSQNYTVEDISGGTGTYSKAVLNFLSDKNTLWWDWTPDSLSGQQSTANSFPYYELVLSATNNLQEDELINIAKSVRIQPN
jgi:hypothetical protein